MPKPTSEKQLAANRRNAQRSTGPRTAKGREISRMNALKHGILSRQVLVDGRHYNEDGKELEALHQRFWDEYEPSGPLEEMLVDQIVTAHWRLRRALIAESGAIAMNVDGGKRRRENTISPTLQWMHWRSHGDPVHNMRSSSIGAAILLDWLNDLRKSVENAGRLTEEAVQKITRGIGNPLNSLTLALEDLRLKQATEANVPDADIRQRNEALAFLNREINSLQWSRDRCAEEEEQDEDSRKAAAVLPSSATLEKILRYETKLERQMFRAMAQLERLQRMRRGESVPAPLSVDVSNGT